jgi:hypothetical protein
MPRLASPNVDHALPLQVDGGGTTAAVVRNLFPEHVRDRLEARVVVAVNLDVFTQVFFQESSPRKWWQ